MGALATAMLASHAIAGGCAASFDPASRVNALRVLAVTPDKPYINLAPANPDGTFPDTFVNFEMTLFDGYTDPEGGSATRPIQIVWLGGCFDPPGDQYFACYEQLGGVLKDISSLGSLPEGVAGVGPTFKLKIPRDIVTKRPAPPVGPHYGIGYVFFIVCAGQIMPVPPDGTGKAPDFPLGCFDGNKRLGAESFVAGYTQIYSFADERQNENPAMAGMKLDDKDMPEGNDLSLIPTVKACPLTEDERRTPSCTQETPASCEPMTLKAIIDPGVAEIDPDGKTKDGAPITEAVWISYFADRGDIAPGLVLVNDAVSGFNPDFEAGWLPPAEPGITTVWAVLRDARGGSSVVQRLIRVE